MIALGTLSCAFSDARSRTPLQIRRSVPERRFEDGSDGSRRRDSGPRESDISARTTECLRTALR